MSRLAARAEAQRATGDAPVDHAGDGGDARRPALLDIRDLSVTYGGAVWALRNLSMRVPDGGLVAVLGSNGAGKTTLLRAISGTLPMQSGEIESGSIELAGTSLLGSDPATIVRSGVVQVPEGRRVFGDLTVEENLRAGAMTLRNGRSRARARARVYDLFPRLSERRSQPAALLSGGEQQMLAIGRALMSEPRLLLFDEPSLGLAPMMVERIAGIIGEINRQGTSVMLVEQNAAMALGVADRAVVLELGRVTLAGEAGELARTDEVRNRYLGVTSETKQPAPEAGRAPTRGPARRSEPKNLSVTDLSVHFGGVRALDDVSFAIDPHEVHALIGPNGAGKSTCLNVITGVYAASRGSIRYGEHELLGMRPHRITRLGVSRTFQNISLSPALTVAQNLLVGGHRLTRSGFVAAGLGLPWAHREQASEERRVRAIAELVGLDGQLDRPVAQLAYGDRKRVELGRALSAEPELLLLDEPVAGMSVEESETMARTIADLRAALGISILLVEHNMMFVMGIADRVTVLDFGECIAAGTPAEVQGDRRVLAAYLGAPGDQQEPERRTP